MKITFNLAGPVKGPLGALGVLGQHFESYPLIQNHKCLLVLVIARGSPHPFWPLCNPFTNNEPKWTCNKAILIMSPPTQNPFMTSHYSYDKIKTLTKADKALWFGLLPTSADSFPFCSLQSICNSHTNFFLFLKHSKFTLAPRIFAHAFLCTCIAFSILHLLD